ncbi:unnamed protein product [Rhizophagus irregularis]|uniref:Serine-threonine/tyrosine-protein kinase catalytic domain-containing protein n=1 Tax=Rhizophagus irregularis TaxID=588596 RepID=A0A916E6E7_9GLOM|nr:unnamed protein product [Rhizophagus irregularis]
MDETPKNLWEDTDTNKYQYHVTIPTIDSTIESENVDERVVYIGDLEKRKQAYGICGEYFLNEIKSHLQIYLVDVVQCFGITQDPNNKEYMMVIEYLNSSDLSSFQFSSDTNYTIQSTSANPISECLDVQLSELELNEICQDGEDNIE